MVPLDNVMVKSLHSDVSVQSAEYILNDISTVIVPFSLMYISSLKVSPDWIRQEMSTSTCVP